ncbi:MAG: type 1 glutamine amidotransferase [Bacteroidales bacterium]|nr:type 1 glutamine amidotransferase [Bacteroidales bacterium]
MKIHCIRHEPFEGLAFIEDWINENQGRVSYTLTYLNQQYPEDTDFDLLIIMGGTASVYDKHFWISEEKVFIRRAIENKKKILGICLGAQLLASTLGAKVYPGAEREIGWFPVSFRDEARKTIPVLPATSDVFHWHSDTFDLPEGSVLLASTAATPNQGFIYNQRIIALQFHLEMTYISLQKIIRGAGSDLHTPGKYVQTATEIKNQKEKLEPTQSLMSGILDYLRDLPEAD